MSVIQLLLSVILYFVIFFGVSFIINMLLRLTWFMSFVYPIFVVLVVDKIKTSAYFIEPKQAFSTAYSHIIALGLGDIIILTAGFAGTIVAGFVMKWLRKNGYQMF
ncbi:MAG TPA: YuiB family protein [Bacillota bacterium]|nr:YuiB family protein [Bacillota bacterium]